MRVWNDIIAVLCKTLINKLSFPTSNDLFKANNRNSRKRQEMCSKLIVKTPERCQ